MKRDRSTAIVWFRRDLRLADQPALHAAVASGAAIVPLYIDAPEEEAPWQPGAASRAWLARSLAALTVDLARTGAPLVLRRGPTIEALRSIVAETGATALYFNRRYEPVVAQRDRAVVAAFPDLQVHTFNASLLREPWNVRSGAGGPYRVFTPFWRAVSASLQPRPPLPAPKRIASVTVRSLAVETLGLRPRLGWDFGFDEIWEPGERGAQRRLAAFLDNGLLRYATDRDFPAIDGTSRLSPHLAHGEIGPQQVLWALASRDALDRASKFLSELGWREFSYHLLHHFPHTADSPLDPKFDRFAWNDDPDESDLEAWRRGRTGVPIVDAGMRQLWRHGWMHNRVRMLAASLLTKNLRRHWRIGARWFWETLVDADLACNTQGWQWVAGCGADASPYFRVFNPLTQAARFDPDGGYVRRWAPERIEPIVDLAATREAALAAYRNQRAG